MIADLSDDVELLVRVVRRACSAVQLRAQLRLRALHEMRQTHGSQDQPIRSFGHCRCSTHFDQASSDHRISRCAKRHEEQVRCTFRTSSSDLLLRCSICSSTNLLLRLSLPFLISSFSRRMSCNSPLRTQQLRSPLSSTARVHQTVYERRSVRAKTQQWLQHRHSKNAPH
jgi:hypothetical protein